MAFKKAPKTLDLAGVQESLKNIGLELRPHQIEGIETVLTWYTDGHGGILADEMGLGKTCQAICALAMLASEGKSPSLVICPMSVMNHWMNEIIRFSCGELQPIRYYGSKESREKLRRDLQKKSNWNVLVTTFEVYMHDCHLLRFYWEFLVFDEAHRIKNADSQMHKAISMTLPNIGCLLMMTGTPVQTNLAELYSLLKLADTDAFSFDDVDNFVQKYENFKDEKVATEFRMMFQKYCLRRTKEEVLRDVPAASEVVLYHGLTRFQKNMYKALLRNNRSFFIRNTSIETQSRQSLMNTLVQLRKCCLHPYLFKGMEKEPYVEGEHIVNNSGKMLILDRLLKYLHSNGHKVLIFSQMKRSLDIVYDYMVLRDYEIEMMDGSTKSDDRLAAVENFQCDTSSVFGFLLTTKAGGIGLNLTAADTIIFLDWDFNPQTDKQAAARCHRIGQTKPVKIIRLIAKHTVEEIIKYRASVRIKLSEFVLDEKNEVPMKSEVFADLLLEGLKDLEDDKAATLTESRAITDEELEKMIGKTTNGKWEILENNAKVEETEDIYKPELFSAKAMYSFEGEDYLETRKAINRILLESNETKGFNSADDNDMDGKLIECVVEAEQNRILRAPRKIMTNEQKEQKEKERNEREVRRKLHRETERSRKKENLWKTNDYRSNNLDCEPPKEAPSMVKNLEGCIYNVSGDVTKPVRVDDDSEEHALIIHTVDDGGRFGFGGVFSALRKLSPDVANTYEMAGRMKDLSCGDSHLVCDIAEQKSDGISENNAPSCSTIKRKISVVLMVVQSARDRYRKTISISSLEKCLNRVAYYSVKNAAKSVHVPQFWFRVQNIDEKTVRSILRKCLCLLNINVYVYRYTGGAGSGTLKKQPMPTSETLMPSTSFSQFPAKRMKLSYGNHFAMAGSNAKCDIDSDMSDEEFMSDAEDERESPSTDGFEEISAEEESPETEDEENEEIRDRPRKKKTGKRHK